MGIKPEITTIMFDLDGTLLPMDFNDFAKVYSREIGKKAASVGCDPEPVVKAVWGGSEIMYKNNGKRKNIEAFWEFFRKEMGENSDKLESALESFYSEEFNEAKAATGENPHAEKLISGLKEKGYNIIVATNPMFPMDANYSRLSWVGLNGDDFDYITSYENSSFCKPNPKYFEEILEKMDKKPEECLMVGNDVTEDLCAIEAGIETYLITDCIINKENKDISNIENGSFEDFMEYVGL